MSETKFLMVRLPDGTAWPDPEYIGELEWRLRHLPAAVTREDMGVAATICAAYRQLVARPWAARKMPALRRALREGGGE